MNVKNINRPGAVNLPEKRGYMEKVIILKRKGFMDEEYEIMGVFSTKKKIQEYKKWLKENYPPLYDSAKWCEEVFETDKFYC